MSAPVTVSVTRHVDPSRTTEMLAWVQAGTSLAEKFDGFLGSGWVRPSEDSTEWHMLYRFSDTDSLASWEASPQREWWLEAAHGSVEERPPGGRGVGVGSDDANDAVAQEIETASPQGITPTAVEERLGVHL